MIFDDDQRHILAYLNGYNASLDIDKFPITRDPNSIVDMFRIGIAAGLLAHEGLITLGGAEGLTATITDKGIDHIRK